MTKNNRTPFTFEDAAMHASTILGRNEAAHVVNRTISAVQKWTDPDQDSLPNIQQALLLDLACVAKGSEPPFFSAYRALLESVNTPSSSVCLKETALTVQAKVGELAIAVLNAKSPSSAGGANVTASETQEIATVVRQLGQTIQSLEQTIISNIPMVAA